MVASLVLPEADTAAVRTTALSRGALSGRVAKANLPPVGSGGLPLLPALAWLALLLELPAFASILAAAFAFPFAFDLEASPLLAAV